MSKTNKETPKKGKKRLIKLIWLAFLGPFVALVFMLIWAYFSDMPDISDLDNPKSNLASQIITADGEVIGEYYLQNRTNVDYHEISKNLINALVATEDERFYSHSGIDAEALARAIKGMGKDGGGSTLTQQLALNLYGKRAGSFFGRVRQKFGEWIIAAKLEKRYTKEEIMTMYFNKVDFLNQGVGIHSACKVYFSKLPSELNIHEAAMLVGMVKNPNGYNPKRFPEAAMKRREVVLKQMYNNDLLSQEQYDSIRVLPLGLNLTSVDHKDGIAPYFRETLRSDLNKLFNEKDKDGKFVYGNKETGKQYSILKDGLKIYTTIDSRMQKYAEWAVMEHLSTSLQPTLNKKLKSEYRYPRYPFVRAVDEKESAQILNRAKKQTMLYKTLTGKACGVCERPGTKKKKGKYICNFNPNHESPVYTEIEIDTIFNKPIQTQVFDWAAKGYEKDTLISPMNKIKYLKSILRAGMMSMDPKTGFVKAWVGGPNFKYFQYDMVGTGRRQVGSTFKPFVYASAIDAGITSPCDNILNIEHCCAIPDNENRQWCPKNAGIKMDGSPTPVKFGLAASMNNITAAVMDKIGPKKVRENAIKMGINGDYINEYPSIALGAVDLTVREMVGAMSTFANKGVFIKPMIITRIEDKNGAVIYEAMPETEQVFDENLSATMIKMMKGVVDGVAHPTMKT
ncbi:MAG: transglycosylase domain-containing protein, partial [Flavobacteriales bacterium]